MTRSTMIRLAALAGGLALATTVGGCASMPSFFGSSHTVSFNNVSDTALDVRFFVEDTSDEMGAQFVSDATFQVDRGDTITFNVGRNANWRANRDATLHVCVLPVTPSWEFASRTYWLEVLTQPPVSIVATGRSSELSFDTGSGQIAVIPEHEIMNGRYAHRVVNAPAEAMPAE